MQRIASTTSRMTSKPTRNSLKYLLILDFEATCDDSGSFDRREQEIIEFPTLVFNLQENKVQAQFHEYVKPIAHPTLSEFCTNLTGITQKTVDEADTFPAVWNRYKSWLQSLGALEKPSDYAFLTCGDWDLKTMLPTQLAYTASTTPEFDPTIPPPLDCWINIKKSFYGHYRVKKGGMAGMLNYTKLGLEGRHHSGIDDCKNIGRIVSKMRSEKWKPALDLPSSYY